MTLEQYKKAKDENQNIYFPMNEQGQWPGSDGFVKAQDTVVIDGVLFHQDTAGPAYAMANLEDCAEWDIRYLKCPNCGSMVDYKGTIWCGTKVQGYCPACCSKGLKKPTEEEAREAFYRYGQLQTFHWEPHKDSSDLVGYEINRCKSEQYEVTVKYWWGEVDLEDAFKTPDEARQACKAHYDAWVAEFATEEGYIKVPEDCVVVKKESLCAGCRYSLLGEASPPDAAEFYQADPGPFFHEHNK